jgi:hypothetical protein
VSGLRATLRVRDFRALLVSYVINRAGDVIGTLALAVVVINATGSALATAALFLATQFLPGLLGPFVVARVDRAAPGRVLPVLYLVESGVFVVLALIPHDLMPEGKAAFNVALAAATIAGPAIAGVVIVSFDPSIALAIDAATFLLAALLLARTPGLRAAAAGAFSGSARGRLRESLHYIAGEATLRILIFGEGVAFVFFYLVVPVTVVYATRSLHAGAGGYAAILTAWGVGIAIGSAAYVRLARGIGGAMILLSTLGVAAGYLGTAAAPTLFLACASSVIGGVGNGTQWASVETLVHRLVEEAFRARVAAVLEAVASTAPGIGIVIGGALTALLSPRAAYAVAGLGLIVVVTVAWLSRLSLAPPVAESAS